MFIKFLPVIMIVLSSLGYHISQKSTPAALHPIVALIVTYVCASVISIVAFFVFVPKTHLFEAVKAANWSSYLLGFAVVVLELGYLLTYRMGWNISAAGLISNTLVALLLIPIGILLYKETMTLTAMSGVVLCILGQIGRAHV